jgi:hypothetical protein
VSVGYDPDRVRALAHRTREAIDATRRLTSDDPAAGEALLALAALRHTLGHHWMPALLDVLRSDALTIWSRRGPASPAVHPAPLRPPDRTPVEAATRWSGLDGPALLDAIERLDARSASSDPPDDVELDEVAREIGLRLGSDPATVDDVVARAGQLPIVGELIARANAPVTVLVATLATMTQPSGVVAAVDLDRYRGSFEILLAVLADDPGGCLTALGDRRVLDAIAVWHDLDADLVEAVVRGGLHDAVAAEPARLDEGYAVVRDLVRLTSGPLDDGGFHPAMALAVATSMVGYVDTLAPAIRHEGSSRVVVVDHRPDDGRGFGIDLGSYDDLADLFGAVLRDPAAGAALGVVLGGYALQRIDQLGADVARPPGLESVARFTDLLTDAGRSEQLELVAEAAAEESRRRTLAGAVGFGATVALTASGAASITRSLTGRAVSFAADRLTSVAPDRLTDHRFAQRTYDLIVLGALGAVARHPGVRRDAELTSIPAIRWRTIGERVAGIEAETDPAARSAGLVRLERWIATEAPELERYLGEVRSVPGMDELTESRPTAATE